MTSGVKRSFFTKPAWAAAPAAAGSSAPAPAKDESSSSVFGRNDIYRDILQAEHAKKEKKAAKARHRPQKQDRDSELEGPEVKKRRISSEEPADTKDPGYDSDAEDSVSPTISPTSPKSEREKQQCQNRPVTRSTPRKQESSSRGLEDSPRTYKSPSTRESSRRATTVTLHDGDQQLDDDLVIWTPVRPTKPSPSKRNPKPPSDDEESEEEEEEDPYVRKLKAKAREKARLQKLGVVEPDRPKTPLTTFSAAAAAVDRTRSSSVENPQSRPLSSNSASQDYLNDNRATPASEQEDDPQVRILIQSDIPDTKPLIVKRKASQSLKQVKEFWCKKWGLDDSMTRKVFFTWRGTRLFDSTTMRGIILKLKKDYRQQSASVSLDDGGEEEDEDKDKDKDPSEGNIMLEAMTPELYEEKQRQREREQQAQTQQDEEHEEVEAATPAPADDGAIVIRLVAQNLEPMQLRVRPHTTMAKVMRGFAAMRKVDEGKTAWLIFDGERLDPERTVGDVELEDEDEVEVSIR
ncbi:hypothetical protein LTR93_006111 [Exophiala xenobiotica]|nr:hypothetical protein LTR93_006111 [Exophiala xenobiotica]